MSVLFIQDRFKFPDKGLSFRMELVDELPKIVPSTFGAFIGLHQGLLVCIRGAVLIENTTIIKHEIDKQRLQILDALHNKNNKKNQ